MYYTEKLFKILVYKKFNGGWIKLPKDVIREGQFFCKTNFLLAADFEERCNHWSNFDILDKSSVLHRLYEYYFINIYMIFYWYIKNVSIFSIRTASWLQFGVLAVEILPLFPVLAVPSSDLFSSVVRRAPRPGGVMEDPGDLRTALASRFLDQVAGGEGFEVDAVAHDDAILVFSGTIPFQALTVGEFISEGCGDEDQKEDIRIHAEKVGRMIILSKEIVTNELDSILSSNKFELKFTKNIVLH